MKKLLPEENLFLQVFLNDGTNYLEDKAITNHIIGQNVKLNIPIEFTQDVSEIRLDPLNVSCVLQNLKVQIVTKDNNEYEIEHYRHNAIITKDHDFIFASEDPQIIFENQWEIMSERSKLHLESGKQGCRTIRYSVHLVS